MDCVDAAAPRRLTVIDAELGQANRLPLSACRFGCLRPSHDVEQAIWRRAPWYAASPSTRGQTEDPQMSRGKQAIVVLLSVLSQGSTPDTSAPAVWTQSTFAEFREGHFEDAGANTYVSRSGRVQLINKW